MIDEIKINRVPPFQDIQTIDGLKKFNYFFGTNGTGKTTISRVIESVIDYPFCSISWESQMQLETRVYNRDFVDRNFNQQKLKGIFTLGETAKEVSDEIALLKLKNNDLNADIVKLTNTLLGQDGNGGKKFDLLQINDRYKNKFWSMKQKYAATLGGGMTGYLNNSSNFMVKVLIESKSNTAALLKQSELQEKAKKVFSNSLSKAVPFNIIQVTEMQQYENNPILQKRIIGKNDVDIAAMIVKLNNSDWVRQGLAFYDKNEGICPFCQQATTSSFKKSLTEYFDESFTQDSNTLKTLSDNYSVDAQRLQNQIQSLIDSKSDFLDVEKLKSEKQLLDSMIMINKQKLVEKQKESSQIIRLDTLDNVLNEIAKIVVTANEKITENNRIVNNIRNEKANLTDQIWKFVISELKVDIDDYNSQKTAIESAINNISSQINTKKIEMHQNTNQLEILEKRSTSVIPTRDSINHLLDSFGFKSFKLELATEPNTYKLIREDGSDARHTLSEGEKNFLTFLYFYYLLKGSQNDTGIDNQKVVVIDDPISSLDNDVLFLVSALIRELIQDVRDNKGSIKQMFILTHNLYFHKEVTFNKCRNNGSLLEETFWLVKKKEKASFIEKQNGNPIKTTYELLWDEVRKETRNTATIQNTLRRILESYFKLLGGIQLNDLYQEFDGEDKIKCKALCSWVNDGSHCTYDEEYYTPLDEEMVAKFLEVFKQIFDKTKQIAHYNMMMGIV